jgi:hypothetical protein
MSTSAVTFIGRRAQILAMVHFTRRPDDRAACLIALLCAAAVVVFFLTVPLPE